MDKTILWTLIFILCFSTVNAVSIYMPSDRSMVFEPGAVKTFNFYAYNNLGVRFKIYLRAEGALADNVRFHPEVLDILPGDKVPFIAALKLPDELPPGEHIVYITADEEREGTGTVAARGSIRVPIKVRSRYNGIYPIISVSGRASEAGGEAPIKVSITNHGDIDINSASATVEVFSPNNEYLDTVTTDSKSVPYDESVSLNTLLNTSGYTKGDYILNATVNCDGTLYEASGLLKLGELNVSILNTTKQFQTGIIQRFDIDIESDWNNPIEDVYADIFVISDQQEIASLRTPLTDLGAWQNKKINAYWDLADVPLGKYDTLIELNYLEQQTTLNTSIEVLEDLGLNSVEIPEEETPLNTSLLLVLLVIALIIINIVLFISLRNKDRKK